jgi:hypothetical protein
MTMITGARYQIAVDGPPRTNRDDKLIAFKTAEYLKYKNPHSEITALPSATSLGSTARSCLTTIT